MTRSTVIGVAVLVALAGMTACGGSRSQPAVSGPGSAASAPLSSSSTEQPAPHVAVRVVTMRGSEAAGPERYDRVRVVRIGSSSARHVLVLLAGTSAGAGYFVPVAEDLVMALHGWQVWAVDRRENLLEDHTVLDRARAGGVGGRELFDYYLGWIANPAVGRHYRPPADDRVAFARRWGMRVAVADVARVVHAARAGGRDVVLGGHSLGGWIATAYAAWDFGGRAGAADLDGLVLIDGASGPPAISPTDARRTLAGIEHGSAFLAPAGARLPWIAGVLSAVGSTLAVREPDAPSLLQAWPLLPASVKPPVPGDEPRATRALGRHRHEPRDPRRGPGAPRRPGRVRRPARLSGWRLRDRGARRARHQRNRRRRRNRLVSPAPPDARRKGDRRRCRPTPRRRCSA